MICSTPYCRGKRAKGRTICHKCKARRYRENNPEKAAFQNLRTNAKRRGKEFSITFDQFKKFCVKTDYLKKRGRSSSGFHIDRIDEQGPYSIENIQVLTNSENVKKFLEYSHKDNFARYRKEKEPDFKEVPF